MIIILPQDKNNIQTILKKILKFYFLKHLFLHHIIKIKHKSFPILKNSYASEYLHAKIFIYGLQYKY